MVAAKRYPFLNLNDVTAQHREEIIDAVMRVVDSGRYIGGDECLALEQALCRLTGSAYCVGTANGLDALRLIFRAYIETGRLKAGDEVIVPANTYIASVLAVTDNGLVPVLVEPDARTLNLDWDKALQAVTPRTRAVLTVHLYGRVAWNPVVVGQMKDMGLIIVEDNAQAIGAVSADGIQTGALGDAAAFSFYPTKNIGALGDAGAVTTDDAELARMVRALANYGSDRRYHNIVCGYNSRLDPVQAAVLNVKLKYLEAENERRRAVANVYNSLITNPDITKPLPGDLDMVWHQYVIQTDNRAALTKHLDANGVGWDIHYATPPHLQPCYARLAVGPLPVTEYIADTVLSLPVSQSTTSEDAVEIAAILNRAHDLRLRRC